MPRTAIRRGTGPRAFGAALALGVAAGLILVSFAGGAPARRAPTPSASGSGPSGGEHGTSNLAPRSLAVLYDQYNSAASTWTSSQKFEPAFDASDDESADDFVVPAGTTWSIDAVDVQGTYERGQPFFGPAASVNVRFYANGPGNLPGNLIASRLNQGYAGGPSFAISFSPVVLDAGSYWVSVQANQNFIPNGQWGWTDRTATSNVGAAWKNPGGGLNVPACLAWGRRSTTCDINPAAPDQVYLIRGTAVCLNSPATIVGTGGNDTLVGTDGRDVIAGLGGHDQIDGRGGDDLICGGPGDDRIAGGDDDIHVTPGGDQLFGDAGNDTVDGGAGYLDLVEGGPGDDQLRGNEFAVVSYVFAPGGVTVDLERGTAGGGEGNDRLSGFPFVFGSPYNDILIGDRSANVFFGTAGHDTIRGGSGLDIAAFASEASVRANLATGQQFGGAGEGDDRLAEIEGLYGGSRNDDFVGNGQDNFLAANAGHDTIRGGGGADSIFGGDGDDRLFGEAGSDLLEGGAGTNSLDGGPGENDQVSYAWIPGGVSGQSGVTADLAVRSATAAGSAAAIRDAVIGVESVSGSPYADTLAGSSKANALSGNLGRDTLHGRSGNDFLDGGPDLDTADAGTGKDYCLDTELTRRCELTARTQARAASAAVPPVSLFGRMLAWPTVRVDPSSLAESQTQPTCAPAGRGGGVTTISPPKRIKLPGGNETVRWQASLFRSGSRRAIASTPLAEGKLVSPANPSPGVPSAWTSPNGAPINWPTVKRVRQPGIYYWVQTVRLVRLGPEGSGRLRVYYQPPGKASAVKSCDFRARP